mgnify:CR=1 FL=1
MEIVEKTIEDQKVAIMNYKGSLNDMEVLIGKLTGWVEVEEIETIGDLWTSTHLWFLFTQCKSDLEIAYA